MIKHLFLGGYILFYGFICASCHPRVEEGTTTTQVLEENVRVRGIHDQAAIVYLQSELGRNPLPPRAEEYRRILERYKLATMPAELRRHSDPLLLEKSQEIKHNFAPKSNSFDFLQELCFGVYADSMNDEKIKLQLAVDLIVEQVLMNELREYWKQYALDGGAMPANMLLIQFKLACIAKHRHEIAAVQQYRKNQKLVQLGNSLTSVMRSLLQRQVEAYLLAKSLRFDLSVVPEDRTFAVVRSDLSEKIEQKNLISIRAGKSFFKMYQEQNFGGL